MRDANLDRQAGLKDLSGSYQKAEAKSEQGADTSQEDALLKSGASTIGSTAGSAIGTAIAGPAGTVVGGFIGGQVGSAVGSLAVDQTHGGGTKDNLFGTTGKDDMSSKMDFNSMYEFSRKTAGAVTKVAKVGVTARQAASGKGKHV